MFLDHWISNTVITDVDHEIDAALSTVVTKAYGATRTITSKQTADGTYSFTTTYTINGKTATKDITLSGYLSYADYKKTIKLPIPVFQVKRH